MGDEDPMAFLNAHRSKLAAIQQAQEEQAQIAAAVTGIRGRMQQIEAMAAGPVRDDRPVEIQELSADAWREKIAALSAPVCLDGARSTRAPIPSNAHAPWSRQQQYLQQREEWPCDGRQEQPAVPFPGALAAKGFNRHEDYSFPNGASAIGYRQQDRAHMLEPRRPFHEEPFGAAPPRPGSSYTYAGAAVGRGTAPTKLELCTRCLDMPCRCGPVPAGVGKAGAQLCIQCFDIPCACAKMR